MGWPFLARPAQRFLSQALSREVSFEEGNSNTFRLKLLGSPRLTVGNLQIGNPSWNTQGPMVVATQLKVQMRWVDLLRWRPGKTARLLSVEADTLALQLQRLADGRSSWQFGDSDVAPKTQSPNDAVSVEHLALREGTLKMLDAPLQIDLSGKFSDSSPRENPSDGELRASAVGKYRGQALHATLRAGSAPRWLSRDPDAPGVPAALRLNIGRAELRFDGQVRRPLGAREMRGRFYVAGSSLAAVGEPVGVVLPETRRFAMNGLITQSGTRWQVVVETATVGASKLNGAFDYDTPAGGSPMLAGRLRGALLMQDLGPAVGGATEDTPKTTRATGRLLPDRTFDLPALRSMNANVLIDLERLDFGTPTLKPATSLRAQLVLQEGVLALENVQAGLAEGRVTGFVRLDGRREQALWDIDLRGNGLVLEQWVTSVKRAGQAPYATGVLGGRIVLKGQGRSTAALLASANGNVQVRWTQGSVSHLLVEAAGLDLAQALGVLIKGDAPLRVECGVGDLQVTKGRVTPSVLLVDTRDSAIWVDGSLSLADEQMGLTAHVQPKDWSPISLRTPLRIDGAWSDPKLSLEKGPLMKRVVPAALLAMLNPIAALLPLMDFGKKDSDPKADKECAESLARLKAPAT